jgi:hypothetical protein
MIKCVSSRPFAGEFDVLSLWLRVVIVKPLSNFLYERLAAVAQDVMDINTYLAGLHLIE